MWYLFALAPFFGLFLILVVWRVYGSYFGGFGRFFSFIYIFSFMRLGVYFLLYSSWGRNRKYSLLGGYRSVSQTVSYEVSIIFFILVLIFVVFFYDLLLFFFSRWITFFFLFVFCFLFLEFLSFLPREIGLLLIFLKVSLSWFQVLMLNTGEESFLWFLFVSMEWFCFYVFLEFVFFLGWFCFFWRLFFLALSLCEFVAGFHVIVMIFWWTFRE